MMRPSYDTDVTDEQWLKIASLYPEANHRGRPRTQDFREINYQLDILYCSCRLCLAVITSRFSQVADGILLLSTLAERRSQVQHGYHFEVSATGGLAEPIPLKGMGRFRHEAIAINSITLY